jgi:hypothetical protein
VAEHRKNFRLRDEDVANLRTLAAAWGVVPLTDTDVIREALRRAVASLPRPRSRVKAPAKKNSQQGG